MQIAITGATGLIGRRLVERLRGRGDELVVLARDTERAHRLLGVPAVRWDAGSPVPPEAFSGADAVVHLAGANIARRWTSAAKRVIRASRVEGTANLVAALGQLETPPRVLVCASGVGYYGSRGAEPIHENTAAGDDFLARVCADWEQAALEAEQLGVRVARLRTGVVLGRGGALEKMLPPFKAGLGGPVAGGRQWLSWIHLDDVVGLYVAALDDEHYRGPFNATAPEPVTNREFSKALGRALHRPAIAPVPALALKLRYGEMAQLVTAGVNAPPVRALSLGHDFAHPELGEALRSALAG